MRWQIGIWLVWCVWEIYWLLNGTKFVIGLLQLAGCLTTFILAVAAKCQLDAKLEEEAEAAASSQRLQGVLAGQ